MNESREGCSEKEDALEQHINKTCGMLVPLVAQLSLEL
jgi:hypothetical protein